MLMFDIETTGLDPAKDLVTIVCTQDLKTGERVAYEFARVRATEPENEQLLQKDLVNAFDSASSLCAFNGIRFDIPFLYTALNLKQQTCAGWLLKTSDILEAARWTQSALSAQSSACQVRKWSSGDQICA
jgi:uncharacterized protein YprB with RNaseH-like and TPR domain